MFRQVYNCRRIYGVSEQRIELNYVSGLRLPQQPEFRRKRLEDRKAVDLHLQCGNGSNPRIAVHGAGDRGQLLQIPFVAHDFRDHADFADQCDKGGRPLSLPVQQAQKRLEQSAGKRAEERGRDWHPQGHRFFLQVWPPTRSNATIAGRFGCLSDECAALDHAPEHRIRGRKNRSARASPSKPGRPRRHGNIAPRCLPGLRASPG